MGIPFHAQCNPAGGSRTFVTDLKLRGRRDVAARPVAMDMLQTGLVQITTSKVICTNPVCSCTLKRMQVYMGKVHAHQTLANMHLLPPPSERIPSDHVTFAFSKSRSKPGMEICDISTTRSQQDALCCDEGVPKLLSINLFDSRHDPAATSKAHMVVTDDWAEFLATLGSNVMKGSFSGGARPSMIVSRARVTAVSCSPPSSVLTPADKQGPS